MNILIALACTVAFVVIVKLMFREKKRPKVEDPTRRENRSPVYERGWSGRTSPPLRVVPRESPPRRSPDPAPMDDDSATNAVLAATLLNNDPAPAPHHSPVEHSPAPAHHDSTPSHSDHSSSYSHHDSSSHSSYDGGSSHSHDSGSSGGWDSGGGGFDGGSHHH